MLDPRESAAQRLAAEIERECALVPSQAIKLRAVLAREAGQRLYFRKDAARAAPVAVAGAMLAQRLYLVAEVRDSLMQRFSMSRSSAYRAIRAALAERGRRE